MVIGILVVGFFLLMMVIAIMLGENVELWIKLSRLESQFNEKIEPVGKDVGCDRELCDKYYGIYEAYEKIEYSILSPEEMRSAIKSYEALIEEVDDMISSLELITA